MNRDPNVLHFLVYEVNKLYRILIAYDSCDGGVLETVGTCVRVLEEQNALEDVEDVRLTTHTLTFFF